MNISRASVQCCMILVVIGICSVAYTSGEAVGDEALIGYYLFDEKGLGAVFRVSVYEDGGDLYARLGIADYPSKMVLQEGDEHVYVLEFKSVDMTLKFIEDDSGDFTHLNVKSEAMGLDLTGERCRHEICNLRDYHARPAGKYTYKKPMAVYGDWEVGTLHEAGIDTSMIYEMMNDIYENYPYLHSILIVKDGRLVLEEYLNGWDPLIIHRLQSVTKSVTSTLVGIAIEEGIIGSLDDPLYEYLPEYSAFFDEPKRGVLIRHLLTMSAGFEWNELETYYADPKACDAHAAEASGDFIRFVLERAIVDAPGTRWYYNSGYPNMLGYIIEERSGVGLLKFSFDHLLEPLGIRTAYWQPIIGEGRPGCAGGLRLTSRDMARYGYLYLKNGVWEGEQVLPAEWVEESTRWQIDTGLDAGYGYWWWRHKAEDLDVFLASGTGGQYIVCVPEKDIVVVTTAVYSTDKSDNVAGLLLKYVVPAM